MRPAGGAHPVVCVGPILVFSIKDLDILGNIEILSGTCLGKRGCMVTLNQINISSLLGYNRFKTNQYHTVR